MTEEKKKPDEMLPIPIKDGMLEPSNGNEMWYLARVFAGTDMVPKDFKRHPENTFVALAMGMELGISHMQALQNIAVVHGKPTIYGELTIALVQTSGKLEEHDEHWTCKSKWGEGKKKDHFEGDQDLKKWPDDLTAICIMKRKGIKKPYVGRFSVGDAKRIGQWDKGFDKGKGVWQKSPKDMLMWRARHRAEKGFSDVLKGLIPREVAEDYEDLELKQNGDVYEVPNAENPDDGKTDSAVEEFDKNVSQIKESMDEFVALCSSNSGMTDDQIKTQAMGNYKEFLGQYQRWVSATKGPGEDGEIIDVTPEPVEEKLGENAAEAPEGDGPPDMGEEPPLPDPPPETPEAKKEPAKKKPAPAKKAAKSEAPGENISLPTLAKTLLAATKKTLGALIVTELDALAALKYQDPDSYTEIFKKFLKYYPGEAWPLAVQTKLFDDDPDAEAKAKRIAKYFPDYLKKAQTELKATLTPKSHPDMIAQFEKKILELIDKDRHPGKMKGK